MTVDEAVAAYLERVKAAAGVRSDAALATVLGVSKPTISSWRQRGSVPHTAQAAIFRGFGFALDEETEASLSRQSDDLRSHLAALIFLTFNARSNDVNFGGQLDTAYWWAKRFPYLNEFFRKELIRLVDRHRAAGVSKRFGTDVTPADNVELRKAAEEIANALLDGRLLGLDELEQMPYRRATTS